MRIWLCLLASALCVTQFGLSRGHCVQEQSVQEQSGLPKMDKLAIQNEAFDIWLDRPSDFGNSYYEIKAFCDLGFPEEALRAFERVPVERRQENANAIGAIISGLLRHGQHQEALDLIKRYENEILGGSVFPEWRNYALNSMVRYYLSVGDIARAKEVADLMSGSIPKQPYEPHSVADNNKEFAYGLIARQMAIMGDVVAAEEFQKQYRNEISDNHLYWFIQSAEQGGHREWVLEKLSSLSYKYKTKTLSQLFHTSYCDEDLEGALRVCEASLKIPDTSTSVWLGHIAKASPDLAFLAKVHALAEQLPLTMHEAAFSALVARYVSLGEYEVALDMINQRRNVVLSITWHELSKWINREWDQNGKASAETILNRLDQEVHRRLVTLELIERRIEVGERDEAILMAGDLLNWLQMQTASTQHRFEWSKLFDSFLALDDPNSAEAALPVNDYERRQKMISLGRYHLATGSVLLAVDSLSKIEKEMPDDGCAVVADLARLAGVEQAHSLIQNTKRRRSSAHFSVASSLIDQGSLEIAHEYWARAKVGMNEDVMELVATYAKQKIGDRPVGELWPKRRLLAYYDLFAGLSPDVRQGLLMKIAERGWADELLERMPVEEIEKSWEQAQKILARLSSAGEAGKLQRLSTKSNHQLFCSKVKYYVAVHQLRLGKLKLAVDSAGELDVLSDRHSLLNRIAQELNHPKSANVRKIINWLQAAAIDTSLQTHEASLQKNGVSLAWNSSSGKPVPETGLYSGTSGVVLLLDQFVNQNQSKDLQLVADQSHEYLKFQVARLNDKSEPGLFTGFSGIGLALLNSQRHRTNSKVYFSEIQQCVEKLKATAIEIDDSQFDENHSHQHESYRKVAWNNSTDVISGSAGIGMFLLRVEKAFKDIDAFELAIAAGDGLIARASTADSATEVPVLRWLMNPDFPREMPNYSHGTAGVCDFFLMLHQRCVKRARERLGKYDGRFLEAAKAGAEYLLSIESKGENSGLICHHFPDGEELFYLGWCHGPVGTCRFFERLARVDDDPRWPNFVERTCERMLAKELHSKRYPGFWNNLGICCGSAGVGSFYVDRYRETQDERYLKAAQEIYDNIMSRATSGAREDGAPTICWEFAEHRSRPEFVQTQTGLMQGAAGIGLFFLQLESVEKRKDEFSVFELLGM